MSIFKLNVSEVINDVSSVQKSIGDYQEVLSMYLNNMCNVDSVWDDNNTNPFINSIVEDRKKFYEHIESLEDYLKIIEKFCKSMKEIVESRIDINLKQIDYNLDNVNKLIYYLNICYEKLNKNYYIYSQLTVDITNKNYYTFDKYKNETLYYRNKVYNVRDKIIKIRDDIESLIFKTKTSVDRFKIKQISSSICEHSYKIVSSNFINTIKK